MGLLDDLKREANDRQSRNELDAEAIRVNTRAVDGALRALFLSLNDLAKSLNILKPQFPEPYMLPHVGVMDHLSMTDFFCDYRTMNVDGKDRFTEVYIAHRCLSSQEFNLSRDVVAAQRLRDALWTAGVKHKTEEMRDDRKVLTHEKFSVQCDFPVQVNFEGEHPAGLIRVTYKNVREFNTVTQTIVADKITPESIEEFAKLLLGRDNRFKDTYKREGPVIEIRKRDVVVPQYVIHDVPDPPPETAVKQKTGLFGTLKSLVKGSDDSKSAQAGSQKNTQSTSSQSAADDRRATNRNSSEPRR
jgi:hypothetical protein